MSADLLALLDELDEVRAAATPGPWFAWDRGVGWHLAVEDPEGVDHLPGRPKLVPEGMRTDLARAQDAKLIVAAVNALPELIAALRAVESLISAEQYAETVWAGYVRRAIDGTYGGLDQSAAALSPTAALTPGQVQP